MALTEKQRAAKEKKAEKLRVTKEKKFEKEVGRVVKLLQQKRLPDREVQALSSTWQKMQRLKEKRDSLSAVEARINRLIKTKKVRQRKVKRMEEEIKEIKKFAVSNTADVKTLELTFQEQLSWRDNTHILAKGEKRDFISYRVKGLVRRSPSPEQQHQTSDEGSCSAVIPKSASIPKAAANYRTSISWP